MIEEGFAGGLGGGERECGGVEGAADGGAAGGVAGLAGGVAAAPVLEGVGAAAGEGEGESPGAGGSGAARGDELGGVGEVARAEFGEVAGDEDGLADGGGGSDLEGDVLSQLGEGGGGGEEYDGEGRAQEGVHVKFRRGQAGNRQAERTVVPGGMYAGERVKVASGPDKAE